MADGYLTVIMRDGSELFPRHQVTLRRTGNRIDVDENFDIPITRTGEGRVTVFKGLTGPDKWELDLSHMPRHFVYGGFFHFRGHS